jgi:hypothetical protein
VRTKPRRVGFIVDSFLPRFDRWQGGWRSPRILLNGWRAEGAVAMMRFAWIADSVHRGPWNLRYEWYRPWRRYDAVIFLKSMSAACHELALRLQNKFIPAIFDANVDYYSPTSGQFFYEGMAPTPDQREKAAAMTKICDAVIADSSHIANQCQTWNADVTWIPDNVDPTIVPPFQTWLPARLPIPLIWSGEAVKLADLLAIKQVLIKYARYVKLIMVTNSLDALDRWFVGYKEEFLDMLQKISHEIIPFRSVPELLARYAAGGVVISPRFLNNSYNLGHTEWKITLGMACGRLAICSPVQSYIDVANRSAGRGIRICSTDAEWENALDSLLSGAISQDEELEALKVVAKHYSTPVVASQHAGLLNRILSV